MTERMDWAQARLTEFLASREMDPFDLAMNRLQEAIYDVEYCPNEDEHECCIQHEGYKLAVKALDKEINEASAAFEDFVSQRAS